MQAKITVQPDVNTLALSRILTENGCWLIQVHNRRIVKMTKVPKEQPVEVMIGEKPNDGDDESSYI